VRTLLVQADDFGLTEGVTKGILQAMDAGVVTGSGAMVCEAKYRERVARFARAAGSRLGIHLQLTDGAPILPPQEIPSLVDASGRFPRHRDRLKLLNAAEVLREWRAQIGALRELGVEPNHLDTHHSVHPLAGAAEAYLQLALDTGLPVRGGTVEFNRRLRAHGVACADQYLCIWTGRPVRLAEIPRTLRALDRFTPNPGSVEIACHPALVDEELTRRSNYAAQRQEELAILCNAALRVSIEELGYRIAGPEALREEVLGQRIGD
jgi:chitin disaccharide deacetylase